MFREASRTDFDAIMHLYGQLNGDDSAVTDGSLEATFELILETPGLTLFVLDEDAVVATTYLNVVPNLTRGGRSYAVIENVVVEASRRGSGLGRRLMAGTLQAAWEAGCYKAMLGTGRSDPAVHGFYRACGFSSEDKTAFVARP